MSRHFSKLYELFQETNPASIVRLSEPQPNSNRTFSSREAFLSFRLELLKEAAERVRNTKMTGDRLLEIEKNLDIDIFQISLALATKFLSDNLEEELFKRTQNVDDPFEEEPEEKPIEFSDTVEGIGSFKNMQSVLDEESEWD